MYEYTFDKNFVLLGYAPTIYTDKQGNEKQQYILEIAYPYEKVKGYKAGQAFLSKEVAGDLDLEPLIGSTFRTVCSYNKKNRLLFVKKIVFVDDEKDDE